MMTEYIIGALVVFALLICLGALLKPEMDRPAAPCYGKAELMELFSALPPGAVIRVTVENPIRDEADDYGEHNP